MRDNMFLRSIDDVSKELNELIFKNLDSGFDERIWKQLVKLGKELEKLKAKLEVNHLETEIDTIVSSINECFKFFDENLSSDSENFTYQIMFNPLAALSMTEEEQQNALIGMLSMELRKFKVKFERAVKNHGYYKEI